MGYTKEQIEIIRNFTGTEEQIYALSAELWLSTYVLSHSHSSTYSQATLRTDWSWTQAPNCVFTDILAVAWSEGMYLDTGSSSTYGKCGYGANGSTIRTTTPIPDLNKGAYIKIPMTDSSVSPAGSWCHNGKFGYKITRQANVLELAVQAVYGHSQLTINPSVTFGVSTGGTATAGITFSTGCIAQDDKTYDHFSL